ncbi:mCG145555, partial [Mus musculus]
VIPPDSTYTKNPALPNAPGLLVHFDLHDSCNFENFWLYQPFGKQNHLSCTKVAYCLRNITMLFFITLVCEPKIFILSGEEDFQFINFIFMPSDSATV